MYKFEHIEYFCLLIALIFALGVFLIYYYTRNKQLRKMFTERNLKNTVPEYSKNKSITKFAILTGALFLIVLAIANPLAGKQVNKQVQSKGSDIQFVVDISNSMLCEDIKPNRLSKVKQIMLGMLNKFGADRAGLIVFAGDAYIQLPITIDQTAIEMFVRNLNTDLISRQGTNVEQALQVAITSIDSSKAKHPAIVFFSDGEAFEGNPDATVSILQKRNIPIYTIAIGTEKGGPVPIYSNNIRAGYKKDENGNTVITKPNETLLKTLSIATGGRFVGINELANASETIMNELAKTEKEENREMVFHDYKSLYLWALIPALILLILEFVLFEKRMEWQNIFHNFIERRHL